MSNDLIVITKENALEIFSSTQLDDYLKAIEKDALNFVATTKTKKGRDAIKSKAYSIAQKKTEIDKFGKTLTENWKKKAKQVDDSRKKSRDFLDTLKVKVRQPLTDYEAEQERIEQERRDQAELELAWDEAIAENELWKRELKIRLAEEEQARIAEEKRQKEEAERKEKERIEYEARIAKEAKEKAERDAKEKVEAAQRAKIQAEEQAKADAKRAEQEKKEAAERAEREKQEAINQAKLKQAREIAEEARLKRVAEEKKKAEDEKKAKHHAHIKKFNREALECFKKNGFEEDTAKNIITLIAKNQIDHITINY